MKRIVFFTLMVSLLGTGCGGNSGENSGAADSNDTIGEQNYRNGRSTADTTVVDSVDSVLPPTPPPMTPVP